MPHDIDSSEEHESIPSSPCERMQRDLHEIKEETAEEPLEHIVQAEERGLGVQLLHLRINAAPSSRRQHVLYPTNGQLPCSVILGLG